MCFSMIYYIGAIQLTDKKTISDIYWIYIHVCFISPVMVEIKRLVFGLINFRGIRHQNHWHMRFECGGLLCLPLALC